MTLRSLYRCIYSADGAYFKNGELVRRILSGQTQSPRTKFAVKHATTFVAEAVERSDGTFDVSYMIEWPDEEIMLLWESEYA